METFMSYILKVNIAIVVLSGFYCLFLSKDTFFRTKRILLLAMFVFSLCHPFLTYSFNWKSANATGYVLSEKIATFTLPELIVSGNISGFQELIIAHLPLVLYFTGVVVLIFRIIIQLTGIAINIRQSSPAYLEGRKVYIFERQTNPYSFFQWIILDDKTLKENDVKEILRHEETHVKQWHSVDVLFSQLMNAFCWFNPFVWLMNREIRLNLEFLADHTVLASGYEPEHYQFHILRLSYYKAAAKLYNNFNYSPLKKRIKMMNKKETSRIGFFKYILIVPVIGTLLLVNCSQKEKIDNGRVGSQSSIIDLKPAVSDSVFVVVDEMPQFPGGNEELMKFINDNVKYPSDAKEQRIQGRVFVRFIVDKTGKVKDVTVIREVATSLDNEAVRVIKMLPDFIPGKQKGEVVNVYYQVPIMFTLP